VTTARSALAGLLLACCAAAGCRRREPAVAALRTAEGTVERSTGSAWTRAEVGATFAAGDALRTGPRSAARLAVASGGVISVGENGRLRFVRGASPGRRAPDLVVELGAAEIEDAASALAVETSLGPARIDRGGHVRVRADGAGVTFEVLVGRAVVLRPDGALAIEAGEGIRIKIGDAVVRRAAPPTRSPRAPT
jgi:hypothetical protein